MSRILDALRRSERENRKEGAALPSPDTAPLQDLLVTLEAQPGNLESVARLVCRANPEEPLVCNTHNHDVGAEKFRVLCHRLRQLRQRRPLSRVLVTSAIPKEGKTVVALNLALTLAFSSPRVLLVDTDMRQSGLEGALGIPPLPGLADFLEGRLELSATFRRLEPLGLHYLAAGNASSNPVELLQRPRMRELMEQTARAFDWVVFDSPPVNPFADAHCLAGLADAVLLVTRSGWTPREGLQQALTALEGAYIAGVVLNGSGDPHRDHYYYYYYANSGRRKNGTSPQQADTQEGLGT